MPKAATSKSSATVKPAGKAKKDPNAPKRALSAFMFYSQDQRENVKSANPGIAFGEVGKVLGAQWQALTPAQKKKYDDLATKDKTRAAKEKEAYEKGGVAPAKKAAAAAPVSKSKKVAAPAEDDDEEDESD